MRVDYGKDLIYKHDSVYGMEVRILMIRPRCLQGKQGLEHKKAFKLPRKFYAKTRRLDSGEIVPGVTVFQHCHIVGRVAEALLRRMRLNLSPPLSPAQCGLVAAVHDIGKINPAFQKKIFKSLSDYRPEEYPELASVDPTIEKNWGGHGGISQITLNAMGVPRYIPEIVGQHHGYTPEVGLFNADSEVLGGPSWQKERVETVERLKEAFCAEWPEVQSPENARLLAGLTSVADWIGSGEIFDDPDGLLHVSGWMSKFEKCNLPEGCVETKLFGTANANQRTSKTSKAEI